MGTALVDTFGRVHRDLRISVTDRCNFRCQYCMPAEGLAWMPRDEQLSYDELARVAGVFVERFGFESVRLTGGEPTVRADLVSLVERLAPLRVGGTGERIDLALTTNGTSLPVIAPALAAAGLRRINISCDSLRPERFAAITRRDALPGVLAGIDAAIDAGLAPVKLNVVVLRGVNDDELVDFAAFGRAKGIEVRFIEFMPLDAQGAWTDDQVVTQAEIVSAISAVFPLDAVARTGSAPSTRFAFADGLGSVGIIPSVTDAFCDSCDRVRLTSEGMVRSCLFAVDEYDLRSLLRGGASDDELAEVITRAVQAKWAGHAINQPVFVRPTKSMSQIGG